MNRTRNNTAAIEGLASAIRSHAMDIHLAIRASDETRLQTALANLMMDTKCIDDEIALAHK